MIQIQEISGLAETHALSELAITRLQTEYQVLRLQVEYGAHQAVVYERSFVDALLAHSRYKKIASKLNAAEGSALERKLGTVEVSRIDSEVINAITLDLFLHSNKVRNICKGNTNGACFSYTCKRDIALIHFTNAVVPLNPLKEVEVESRKRELRLIAQEINAKHPEIKRLGGCSWIRNLDAYLRLFPTECRATREFTSTEEGTSMGQWGQFYRYDGTFNETRAAQFRKSLEFPLKSLASECPIESFFEMYLR